MADFFAIATHSLNGDLNSMNVIAENMANVHTVGYKRRLPIKDAVSFERLLDNVNNVTSVGHRITTDYESGSARKTGNPLDVFIEGDGWIEITKNGRIGYTRSGELKVDASGILMTQSGWEVIGDNGTIRLSSVEPKIMSNGEVWDENSQLGTIKLVHLNSEVLPLGGGAFSVADPSAVSDASVQSQTRLRQGYVENSNVKPMNETIDMIQAARHFELMQRFVKAYDGLLETTISKLGKT